GDGTAPFGESRGVARQIRHRFSRDCRENQNVDLNVNCANQAICHTAVQTECNAFGWRRQAGLAAGQFLVRRGLLLLSCVVLAGSVPAQTGAPAAASPSPRQASPASPSFGAAPVPSPVLTAPDLHSSVGGTNAAAVSPTSLSGYVPDDKYKLRVGD